MKSPGSITAGDCISHLKWNPEGTRLLITPVTGALLVVDETATLLEELPGHGMGNGSSDWFQGSPATCGFDGKIHCGSREWKPGRGMIEHVRTNADGSLLAAAQGKVLHIFDGAASEEKSLRELPAVVADFAWNPKSSYEIATVGAGGALLWRLGEKEPFARFDWGGASLQVRWSNDGRWLATADQTASVHVYDIPRDHPLNMEGFECKVRALGFSADGKRLATAGSPVVTVWPCASKTGPEGANPIQVDGSGSEVRALEFSPVTGQLATGDGEGTLLVVTFEKGQFRRKRARLGSGISALAWHPSKPLLAVGHESGSVMWLSLEG
ncbi:MAG: WD40 repeat domain-containing protein [bacterium]